ncbi:MAG: EAL domain-containing protein, partial [Myxococcales bacterium]|nr:EAL domain-containing protein [Myxococcales bacterium]
TRGLDETLLTLHYQPITDAKGRAVTAEALLRWDGPAAEPIGPLELVQVAEETGQIHALGRFVLRAACQQVARWQRIPHAPHRVAVNVSALQMRTGGFVADVREALGLAGVSGDSLELELTESIFVRDLETVIRNMTALRGLGVRFAIDDFGTGYSSLAYLRRLPIDALKIDRSFVREIAEDAGDAAIVEASVLMARRLGLSVVAEGVETEAQRDLLLGIGCTHLQGYLFGRPGPADDIARQQTAPLTHLHSDE